MTRLRGGGNDTRETPVQLDRTKSAAPSVKASLRPRVSPLRAAEEATSARWAPAPRLAVGQGHEAPVALRPSQSPALPGGGSGLGKAVLCAGKPVAAAPGPAGLARHRHPPPNCVFVPFILKGAGFTCLRLANQYP